MKEPSPAAGYSGTPLARKLGLTDGQAAFFAGLPEPLGWLTGAAQFIEAPREKDCRRLKGRAARYDVIHAFFTAAAELAVAAPFIRAALKPDGMAWISWPKKAAKRPTDITEDTIRDIVLPIGLVDVKVAAVDEVWSGLKLVIRKELRSR